MSTIYDKTTTAGEKLAQVARRISDILEDNDINDGSGKRLTESAESFDKLNPLNTREEMNSTERDFPTNSKYITKDGKRLFGMSSAYALGHPYHSFISDRLSLFDSEPTYNKNRFKSGNGVCKGKTLDVVTPTYAPADTPFLWIDVKYPPNASYVYENDSYYCVLDSDCSVFISNDLETWYNVLKGPFDISVMDKYFYIDNFGRIYVIDTDTFDELKVITDFTNPDDYIRLKIPLYNQVKNNDGIPMEDGLSFYEEYNTLYINAPKYGTTLQIGDPDSVLVDVPRIIRGTIMLQNEVNVIEGIGFIPDKAFIYFMNDPNGNAIAGSMVISSTKDISPDYYNGGTYSVGNVVHSMDYFNNHQIGYSTDSLALPGDAEILHSGLIDGENVWIYIDPKYLGCTIHYTIIGKDVKALEEYAVGDIYYKLPELTKHPVIYEVKNGVTAHFSFDAYYATMLNWYAKMPIKPYSDKICHSRYFEVFAHLREEKSLGTEVVALSSCEYDYSENDSEKKMLHTVCTDTTGINTQNIFIALTLFDISTTHTGWTFRTLQLDSPTDNQFNAINSYYSNFLKRFIIFGYEYITTTRAWHPLACVSSLVGTGSDVRSTCIALCSESSTDGKFVDCCEDENGTILLVRLDAPLNSTSGDLFATVISNLEFDETTNVWTADKESTELYTDEYIAQAKCVYHDNTWTIIAVTDTHRIIQFYTKDLINWEMSGKMHQSCTNAMYIDRLLYYYRMLGWTTIDFDIENIFSVNDGKYTYFIANVMYDQYVMPMYSADPNGEWKPIEGLRNLKIDGDDTVYEAIITGVYYYDTYFMFSVKLSYRNSDGYLQPAKEGYHVFATDINGEWTAWEDTCGRTLITYDVSHMTVVGDYVCGFARNLTDPNKFALVFGSLNRYLLRYNFEEQFNVAGTDIILGPCDYPLYNMIQIYGKAINNIGSVETKHAYLTFSEHTPYIETQPVDVTGVRTGDTVTFTVTARYCKKYIWVDTSDSNDTELSNSASLIIPDVQYATHNNKTYQCHLRNENGTVSSNIVTISMIS